MSRFANALANANARRSPCLAITLAVKNTTIKWNTTGLDEYHTLGPHLGHCKVVAHAVISMDRMYNGRAATMNIVASGSLMRWIALAFLQFLTFPETHQIETDIFFFFSQVHKSSDTWITHAS